MKSINFSFVALSIGIMVAPSAASAEDYRVGSITIGNPWSRATPSNAQVAAGYMTITNSGEASDRLIGGTATISKGFQLDQMTEKDGVMVMRPLVGGLEVKPGETITLKPGGIHAMFMGLKAPLKEGEHFKGALRFETAGWVEFDYAVRGMGASAGE